MKELIKWKGISFGYQEEKKVLKDVDLSIQKGEKIVVIGSNGAGKSTLFLLLNGILKPESGSYAYKGREIHYTKQEMTLFYMKLIDYYIRMLLKRNITMMNLQALLGFY